MDTTIYLYNADFSNAVAVPGTPAVRAELRGINGWRFSWSNAPGFHRHQAVHGVELIATFNEDEAILMLTSRCFPVADREAA